MSPAVRKDRPGRVHPSLFGGNRCKGCPVADICGARAGDDACGHAVEYDTGALLPDSIPRVDHFDFEFPETRWRPVPHLPSAVTVGSRVGAGIGAVRLADVLALVQRTRTQPTPGIAVLLGADHQLRRLVRREGAIGPALASRGFAVAISPGFSVWWNRPPFESLVNIAHSARFAAELNKSVPTVPTVVWRTDSDIRRWGEWLRGTNATHAAMDLGTLRHPDKWLWAVHGIRVLDEAWNSPQAQLVASGPFTIERFSSVREAWSGKLTFLSQRPWHLARRGELVESDLGHRLDDRHRDQLVVCNDAAFRHAVDLLVTPSDPSVSVAQNAS